MRKIFNGTYKHLDDDVSFQILRTNPRLSTNTKLMYDGESMYLESYDANELLSTQKYKNKQIWKSGLYNNDIKNFLQGTGSSAFIVGNKMRDTIVGNDYAYQYENMYWCGAEAVTSKDFQTILWYSRLREFLTSTWLVVMIHLILMMIFSKRCIL